MVKTKDVTFSEPKKLPTLQILRDVFGLDFNTALRGFSALEAGEEIYHLDDFISDYYEMDLLDFRRNFESRLGCKLNENGYILGMTREDLMPIRNLAYFANKERKFAKELGEGRERGNWVKTIHQDVGITTSQTDIVADFINSTIINEGLNLNDIILLRYLKRADRQAYSIYKIFSSVDVRLHKINGYADGFFGRNEDYSEDIDRLELDIIKAIQGGCNKRELKSNDTSKRITHPKASNNNCFFKCIQPFVPALQEKIIRSECNRIRMQFGVRSDDPVDVNVAMRIFENYSRGKYGLEIWSADILIGELKGTDSTLKLLLHDGHYSIMEIKKYECCSQCGRKFINKHTCNTNMIVYKKT